ncbi:MAG TPA: MopE-related protein [Polyangiaceae bacterium]
MSTLGYLTRIASYTSALALLSCSTGESRLDDGKDAGDKQDASSGGTSGNGGTNGNAGTSGDAGTSGNDAGARDGGSDAGGSDAGGSDAGGSDAGGSDAGSDGGCVTCYLDGDRDGYAVAGADSEPVCGAACRVGFTSRAPVVGARDCNDTDALISPVARERCNGVSDNCDAVIDEGAATTCSLANATPQCTSGQCRVLTCNSGYGDCSATAGCEQPLNVAAHCGACARTCPALSACAGALGSARCQCAAATFEVPSPTGVFSCMGSGPLALNGDILCAIRATGAVSCWGGTAPAASARFKQITLAGSFGAGAACGVTPAGTIQCWLAHTPILSPPHPPPAGSSYLAASMTGIVCGIDTAGRATCSSSGNLSPTRIYRQIIGGFGHTCALAADGNVTCWGLGIAADPECGGAGLYECGQAVPLAGPFVQLALGGAHSCGLRPNGTVECWGAGRKAADPAAFEHRQGIAPAVPFRYIAAAGNRTCGIRAIDNVIQCWGEPYEVSAGVAALPPAGEYDVVLASDNFACALTKTSNNIRCWGKLQGLNGAAIPASITGPFPLIPPG